MSSKQNNIVLAPEQLQLLACLKAYIRGEKAPASAVPADEDAVGRLFALAYIHKLIPIVGDTAVAGTAAAETEQGKRLLLTAKKQAVLQAYASDAFRSCYNELGKLGLSPIVLKGELCRTLYLKPELRLSSDEDLYLPGSKADELVDAMLGMGFAVSGDLDAEHQWQGGVISLNSPNGLHIEVHKRLSSQKKGAEAMERALTNAPTALYEGQGGACPITGFAPTWALYYLFAHAAKHFTSGGFGVRTAADICAFTMCCYNRIELDRLASMLKQGGMLDFARAVYDISVKHLGYDEAAYPLGALYGGINGDEMLIDCLAGGVYGTATVERAQSAKYTAGAAEGISTSKTELRALFPPARQLEGDYPFLKKSRLLLPAAWAKRIAGYLRSGRRDAQRGAKLGRRRAELIKKYIPAANERD